jgi:hypothetical protein
MLRISYLLVILLVGQNVASKQWVKPDAWSRYDAEQKMKNKEIELECNCPPPVICEAPPEVQPPSENSCPEKELAMVLYKKFVNYIFSRDRLEVRI